MLRMSKKKTKSRKFFKLGIRLGIHCYFSSSKMEIKRRKICRLCLKICDTNFEAIDGITRESFEKHLSKLDLTIGTYPVMCRRCAEKFNEYCNFKSRCLDTQHHIVSFINDNFIAKVNITEIYHVKKRRENIIDITEDHKVCRFCMELVESDTCIYLNNEEKDTLLINIMLHKCLEELDLSITEEPVICLTCYDSLQSHYEFLMYCFDTEKRIREYCETERIDSKDEVELCDMLKFAPANMSECNGKSNCFEFIELPAKCFKTEDSSNFELHISNENFTKMKKIKTQIEKEEYKNEVTKNEMFNYNVDFTKTKGKTLIVNKEEIGEGTKIKNDQGNLNSSMLPLQADISPSLPHENPLKSKMYKCEECLFETKYNWYFEQHVTSHKDKPVRAGYNCAMCTYNTKRRACFEKHLALHEKTVIVFKCAKCPFETKYKSHLCRHNKIHSTSDTICKVCSYVAKRPVYLQQHMKAHREKPKYKCENCIYETLSAKHFRRHMLTHKSRSDRQKYKCAMCDYETICRRSLIKHLPIHKNECHTTSKIEA